MKLSVYLNTYGIRRMVGLLYENAGRVFFEYSPDFLQSGIALSPFKLPLKPGVFEDEKRTFDGLFGLFKTACRMAGDVCCLTANCGNAVFPMIPLRRFPAFHDRPQSCGCIGIRACR